MRSLDLQLSKQSVEGENLFLFKNAQAHCTEVVWISLDSSQQPYSMFLHKFVPQNMAAIIASLSALHNKLTNDRIILFFL